MQGCFMQKKNLNWGTKYIWSYSGNDWWSLDKNSDLLRSKCVTLHSTLTSALLGIFWLWKIRCTALWKIASFVVRLCLIPKGIPCGSVWGVREYVDIWQAGDEYGLQLQFSTCIKSLDCTLSSSNKLRYKEWTVNTKAKSKNSKKIKILPICIKVRTYLSCSLSVLLEV